MKKIVISAYLVLSGFYTISANSEEVEYTALCVEDKSTGFTWENRQWIPVGFKKAKYLVAKINLAPGEQLSLGCGFEKKKKGYSFGNNKSDYGCYYIRDFGEEYISYGRWCLEEYELKEPKSDKYELKAVICNQTILETFVFLPNGPFHRSYVHRFLKTNKDYNDSMNISVGSCSKI